MKFTSIRSSRVACFSSNMELVGIYPSISAAAEAVYKDIRKRQYIISYLQLKVHSAAGFIWIYAPEGTTKGQLKKLAELRKMRGLMNGMKKETLNKLPDYEITKVFRIIERYL